MSKSKDLLRRATLSFSLRNRRRKAARLAAFFEQLGVRSALVVGSAGDDQRDDQRMTDRSVAERVTFVVGSNIFVVPFSDGPYVVCDALQLPFRDGSFDAVVSNAVIEHVGNLAEQQQFVSEHRRVGHSWVITTPNRWFPVEAHTSAVFLHWSTTWRARHREHFTRLLSRHEFAALLGTGTELHGHPWSPTFFASGRGIDPGVTR